MTGADFMTADPWLSVDVATQPLDATKGKLDRRHEIRGRLGRRIGRLLRFKFSEMGDRARARGADDDSKDQERGGIA
jgi:hypothetical protein